MKLLSRKFMVAASTLAMLLGGDLNPLQALIAAAVAAVYIVAQALVDRRTVDEVAQAVEEGIRRGREARWTELSDQERRLP